MTLPGLPLCPRRLALSPEIFQQFPCLPILLAQHRSALKQFLGEAAMLHRVAVALRSTGQPPIRGEGGFAAQQSSVRGSVRPPP